MLGIFLDSETNGLNAMKHRIIEIAFKIIDVRTGELKDQFQSHISASFEEWEKSDPASLQVNGFTWPEVSQAASPKSVGESIIKLFNKHDIKRGEAVFICQNPSFDRIFFSQLIDVDTQEKLLWPYHWLDLASMYWAKAIHKTQLGEGKYPWETGCSKDKIATALSLPKEEKPHRAMNGVNHLLLCYESVVAFPDKKS
ncbi:MAG: exonuclease domain-containing protein [Parachlamydiales bacterium]|nr:3'-5' exonuclease [Verrucomicrobiota bacterium]